MKAKEFLDLYSKSFEGKKKIKEIVEWVCPRCKGGDLPDENRFCPECGYKYKEAKPLYDDKLKKYYESMYNKIFSKIKDKIFETDLVGGNLVRFANALCKYGVIRKLRNDRFVEMVKIPKEFVIQCFVEGDMKRLRGMVWRRKRKQQREYQIRPYQKL